MNQKKNKFHGLKEFYQLYTSGLSRSEIERLLKRESLEVLSYYKKAVSKGSAEDNFPKRKLLVVKEIFLSFVLKLTPARRLFYGLAFILFIIAVFISNWFYGVIAFLILNLLLAFELADKMVSKDELEIARNIQLGLQPEKNPEVKGLEIATFYQPAGEVGGDYYDVIQLNAHRIALIVGDVSGKGMPAALYAVRLQGLFELLAQSQVSPKEMLVRMNDVMAQRLKKNYFITATSAIFDTKEKKLYLARAGHNPAIYFKSETKKTVWLKPPGIGIGLNKNSNFDKELIQKTIDISAGDLFLFYTDGITEARNGLKTQFGEERLTKIVAEDAHLSADEFKDKLVANLNLFVKKALLDDDATFVVIKT